MGIRKRPYALLEKKRIAFVVLDQSVLERIQAGVGSQQLREEGLGGGSRQGINPDLRIERSQHPTVFVFPAVRYQQQNAGSRKNLNERVQYRMAFIVDPLKILEQHDEGMDVAESEDEPLDRIDGPLAARRRIQIGPLRSLRIFCGDIEQPDD